MKVSMFRLLLVFSVFLNSCISSANAQQRFDHRDYYSEPNYSITKHEDLVYGVGSTNYYRYKGSGGIGSRANYDLISEQVLTLDLYEPNTQSGSDKRAVLILIPGSGRNGCRTSGACESDTIIASGLSTSTAQYVSQEGSDYNELNSDAAVRFATRGIVAISPVTRYQYQNRQLDNNTNWYQSNGSPLFNASSYHLEPMIIDLRRLVRWLSHPDQIARYKVDPENIFIMGSSGASKIASLATITETDMLLADSPSQLNPNYSDYQFEVNNNNLLIPQLPLRGAIMLAGDTNGTRNLKLMNSNTGAFMFWQGTTDRSIEHGFAETIEEKCEIVGCATQFYSLPGVEHNRTASGKAIHTNRPTSDISLTAHGHDFIVNHLIKDVPDVRPVLSISSSTNTFSESSGFARIKINLSEPASTDVVFTMSADQMREVTEEDGLRGSYELIEQFVANDQSSTGPVIYDQSTGVAFELASNLPSSFRNLTVHTSGPGEGNPVLIPQNSDYFYNDFVGKKQVLTIPAGSTSATFNVNIVNDSLHEQNECFKVRLLNAQNAKMANTLETITILDDDNPNAISSPVCDNPGGNNGSQQAIISAVSTSVVEDENNASVRFQVNGQLNSNTVVTYRTVNGSATSGSDFTGQQGQTVTITPSNANKTISIPITDDSRFETDENFFVEIVSVTGGNAVIGNSLATVVIVDNDMPAPDPIELSVVTSQSVGEGSGVANIVVTTDRPVTENVRFSYRTFNGSARATDNDFGFVDSVATIVTGRNRITIPVSIVDDNIEEIDEQFVFRLTGVNSGDAIITQPEVNITIRDNDVSMIQAELSVQTSLSVKEGSGTANVVVVLNEPAVVDTTFSYRTFSDTARTSDNDFIFSGGRATIAAGRDRVTVPVTIIDDTIIESNEQFRFSLLEVFSSDAIIVQPNITITIRDNDDLIQTASELSVDTNVSVGEGSGVVNVVVVADQPVTDRVTFSYRTFNGSARATDDDFQFVDSVATILAGRDRVTIPITIIDDSIDEVNEQFTLSLTDIISGNAVIVQADTSITIRDNDDDVGLVELSVPTTQSVSEASGNINIVVMAARKVTEDVTFSYRTYGDSARSGNGDYVFKQDRATIRAGNDRVTISVNIINDSIAESNERFLVSLLEIHQGDAVIGQADVEILIRDDDDLAGLAEISVKARQFVAEDSGQVNIVVKADRDVANDVKFSYRTYGDTARSGKGDYIFVQKEATILAGKDQVTIPITILDDQTVEEDERFSVELLEVIEGDGYIGNSSISITILDNDVRDVPSLVPMIVDMIL